MQRVLVASADAAILSLTAIFLEHLGYQVDVAPDQESALAAARHAPLDLILVAHHPTRLPAKAFVDAYVATSADGECCPVAPVVVLTTDRADRPAPASATHYLLMPFSLDDLERLVWSLAGTDDASTGPPARV